MSKQTEGIKSHSYCNGFLGAIDKFYRGMAFRTYSQYDILDQESYNEFENQRKDLMEEINQTILGVFQDSNIKVKSKFEESDSKIIYSYKIQL